MITGPILKLKHTFTPVLVRNKRHFSDSTFFGSFSEKWWNIDGEFSILHDYNQVRVPFIAESYLLSGNDSYKDTCCNKIFQPFRKIRAYGNLHVESILNGLDVLDIGCGGGILTESLAKYGCKVLGIDPSSELIKAANIHKEHFSKHNLKFGLKDNYTNHLEYKVSTVQEHLELKRKYDIVIASEVIEHIENKDKELFLYHLSELVKPSGILVLTSPGASLKSYIVNILLAERVFHKVPKSTHKFDLFISDRDCIRILKKYSFELVNKQGLLYLPYVRRFIPIGSRDLLYMIAFKNSTKQI
ncbi:hexaprenyldihydroxybenzoate methyltransferase, putative [Theileria equi strain WA]|uniref:Hexaprenyldihydroxybenzoate methyltransferase, putative n=1 Tax=Theileria equi strain WA TaxID=1537102 RepID=L0AU38_THEEQ|nr:hexaprenyldihydroxybenzoate methyltransferase, putative [Theileria equi strain WA]AFZ79065.1 hexaprenyldihydroxybenzoate methyltransferase, putative [Theileria equi strain WA]|eukprot:XP_004828731.1 hexaprenyldihydroxybenzoate methyltransferase, putative [Theileria equi strain WA]